MNSLTKRLLFFLILLVPILAGCRQPGQQAGGRPSPQVAVARPLIMPIVEWDEYTGRLEAIDSVDVRARVSGYLESTHFDEGQTVERGDLLAIIDPRPFKAELNASMARLEEAQARLAEANSLLKQAEAERADADAQLTLANRRLERARRLVQSNAVSRDEIDVRESEQLQATAAIEAANATVESANAGIATARAAIETAASNVEAAELNVQYTQIRAPVSGRISRRLVTEGNLISGGSNQSTLITSIVSLSPIHCYFDANEQEFLKYVRLARSGKRGSSREVKNPVHVALVDENGFPHEGHMDFVDNRIDPNTGTMRGRAILENSDGLLIPGLFVKVRLPGSGRYEAIMVPDAAIGSDQSEKFVYVVSREASEGGEPANAESDAGSSAAKVQRRVVELGPISHGLRIVRSGLDGSETIVTRGLQQIFPGVEVTTKEETIAAELQEDLPDDYEPVPKENWLSRPPTDIPLGVQPNAEPYREPVNQVDGAQQPQLQE